MERLQKIIQKAGIASRRKAEQYIVDGRVSVNGVVVKELGTQVESSDEVRVDGSLLSKEEKVYFVLNKPTGYLSTTNDNFNRRTIMDLIPVKERIFPIGRLDYDTSGVLLLTNDGDFMNALIHPRYKVEKEYHVKVKGLLRKEDSSKLSKGLDLGDFHTIPSKIFDVRYDDKKENTYVKIIITEGKYHQIKRMFEAIDHPVLKLRRDRFGTVTSEGLKQGDYRVLKPHEIKQLWNFSLHGK
ncbi:MAG: rRNA pseudouridine synthase [Firmicutes bacterium]|nr:rRNA pseudouridine synthase [Bacillota bacterium]